MTRKIGIGVIGMGWMGTVHSRAYRQIPDRFPELGVDPRLVVCADEVPARAADAQQRLGFERSVTDWRDVIADTNVEVINIAAPNGSHLEIVRAAAAAGKHIFCEKPVGRNPEETREIESIARQAGVLSFVGFNYRWAPLVQYAKGLIEAGRLGRLTHYRGRFLCGYGADPHAVRSWRFDSEVAGLGALGDLMSHTVDMAHLIAGPVRRVVANRETFISQRPAPSATGTHFSVAHDGPLADVTNEDYVGALATFSNGAHGTLEVCRVIRGPQCQMAFEVHGTLGSLRWNFERMNELELFLCDGKDAGAAGYTRILSGPAHPFHANFNPSPANSLSYDDLKVIEASRFLLSIQEGQQGKPGFSEMLQVANVQSAMLRSWKSENWEQVRS